jgi:hypothetical protein
MNLAAWTLLLLAACLQFSSSAAPIELLELRHSTWTANPANYAHAALAGNKLALTVGIGDASTTQSANVKDMGFGAAGARLNVPAKFEFSARLSGKPVHVDENTLAALVIDYHTPSGYLRRVVAPLGGPLPPGRSDTLPFWGRGSLPEKQLTLTPLSESRYQLDLQPDAPLGWDGQIWLTALIENTGQGTALQLELESVSKNLERISEKNTPDLAVEPITWQNVSLANRTIIHGKFDPAEKLAFDKFTAHLPIALPVSPFTITTPSTPLKHTLIVAHAAELPLLLDRQDAAELAHLLTDDKPWRTEQGYLLKYDAARDVLLAVAGGRRGMIYAISHLQRTLVLNPQPALALEGPLSVEKPKLEERGIYVNIGYGLSMGPITVDNWNEAQWEDFIDRLVLSRVTFWTFFFWADCEYIYPDAKNEYTEKNQRVFAMVRHAVAYARRRGLRSVYLGTPSMVPSEILARHPQWRNRLEYDSPGTICTRQPDAYAMAKDFHRTAADYFKGVDEFDMNFYDPGGCMCEECRKGDVQLEQLVKQVRDYSATAAQANPQSTFGFWTWAVWRYEHNYKYSLQNKLLPRIAEIFKGRTHKVVVIDSLKGDLAAVPYFDEARALGFRTSNFIYQTNIEDGNGLLLPLLDFTRQYAAEAQQKKLDESFLMIMEVNAKYPMAHFGADYFWDAGLTKDRVAGRYALQLTGDATAARSLQQGFVALDRLTYNGAGGIDNFVAEAARMRALFEQAIAATPPSRRPDVAWLLTAARAHELLFKAAAARHDDNKPEYQRLRQALLELTQKDPLFVAYGQVYVPKYFDQFVSWLDNGFKNGQF